MLKRRGEECCEAAAARCRNSEERKIVRKRATSEDTEPGARGHAFKGEKEEETAAEEVLRARRTFGGQGTDGKKLSSVP